MPKVIYPGPSALPVMPVKPDPSSANSPTVRNTAVLRKVGDGSSAIASFQAALNDPSLSDLTLNVRGTRYYVHRCILAIRSPMFRAMITTGYKESSAAEIVIDEFPAEHFHAVLEWIYTGQAHMTASTVLGVLRVADYCQFDDLVRECRELAIRFVDAENLLPLLRSAIHFSENPVVQACLSFWAAQPTAVISRPEWGRATPDALCTLLGHTEIRCSEDVILASAISWLRPRVGPSGPGEQADNGSSSDPEGDDGHAIRPSGDEVESTKSLVGRVLSQIRFGQLSIACLFDNVKPLIEQFEVLGDKYMSTLEFKLDPDRVEFTASNMHLQPRKGQS